VTAASAAAQDIESVLETVCRELALAFDVPQSAAALLNEKKTEAVVVAEYLAGGRPSALGEVIPVDGNPAFQYLLEHKLPLAIEDAQADPRLAPIHAIERRRGTVALLLLPLVAGGEVVGSLGVDAIEPRPFSSEEVDLAWRVAQQVSGILARVRLEAERHRLQEQLRQAQKMEAVGRLAGGIAHDFNNLLTVIQLSTSLLQRKLHAEDPLLEHVKRIQESSVHTSNLVKRLLSFSRQQVIRPRPLDLSEVVRNMSKILARVIGEDILLETLLADAPWLVEIDPSQVDQIIMNLAVNARDAMPDGGRLTIETANAVLDRADAAYHLDVQPGEYVMLAITDTGMGMDDEVKARLFEPFFTTKEPGRGTGLGLATVFGIVKQNAGNIWVYSEPGQGTTFKIYLPRAQTRRAEKPLVATPALTTGGTETILLVEDQADVRSPMEQVLKAHGYHVLVAADGLEALQLSEQYDHPIHLLLTDLVMPTMGGVELAERLRPERPEMRVLYTSGYADRPFLQKAMADPDIGFVPKPFTVESLTQKVRTTLDRRP